VAVTTSEVDPYRVFLRAELGKLQDPGWAAELLERDLDRVRLAFDLGAEADELRARFATQELVDTFIEARDERERIELALALARLRGSPALDSLADAWDWRMERVWAEHVHVAQAEPGLAWLWEELEWRLVRIVYDPRLWVSRPYRDWSTRRRVVLPELLAVRWHDRYWILDGVHRAIQLVRAGENQLSLCVGKPSRATLAA
jgi:hypothetical protein